MHAVALAGWNIEGSFDLNLSGAALTVALGLGLSVGRVNRANRR